jgi:hypothetical protein
MKFTTWLGLLKSRLSGKERGRKQPRLSRRVRLGVEYLETRVMPANFTAGNIAVLDLANTTKNTTASIIELNPSTANQAAPVQVISSIPLRFSDSGTSSFLSLTNDRTLLTFAAYNTTDPTDSDLATVTANDPASDRAVGTLDNAGVFTLQTTYTGTSTNQTRSATSLDDSNFFITDKGGLYTNSATSASLTTNILDTRTFGGVVYVSSTSATSAVSTVSSPTASSLQGLPNLAADSKIQDFYLIQSGSNGSTYDVLYTLDQNSTNATIKKFSLVGGNWISNGSFTVASNATAMIAANNGSGGAFVYVVTTAQAADNSLIRLTDSTGWVNNTSPTTGFTLSGSTTLYTATGTQTLKGLDFVPSPANVPTVTTPTKTGVGTNSATLGGTVTVTGGEAITQRGIVYSATNPNPTLGGTDSTPVPASGTSVGTFTVPVSGLQTTTTYYYAAYATNGVGTGYSSVDTFTTQNANPPSIDTPTDTSITSTSAVLGGTVEATGGATITTTGVVYALTTADPNPQLNDGTAIEVDTTGGPVQNGAFTISATGLTSGKGYTFRAFATNSSGTTYTTPTTFTTLAAPTVTSPTFAAVTGNSATLGANVSSDGGSPITTRGIVYALTSADPTPQLGDGIAIEVDASGTTGVFTVPVTGLSGSTGYTFEAFATNSIGTTYSAPTSFTTAAPGVIAAWTFPATAGAGDNSPAPTFGTGTATTLGMTNSYNGGNTTSDDVLSTSGTANPNFTENLWRIRGTGHNGWATFQNGAGAPQYSQGIQLDTSTVGYSNIVFSFDWYSTTQGTRDLQVQYNTGSDWVNYQGPSPTGTFVATSNDYNNAALSPVNPTIYIDLSGVAAANNNPDLGIRLVSAFDSTGTLGTEYASADTMGGIIPYNNSSGNWRFGNLTFSAGIMTSTTLAASPAGSQKLGQNVTFTATVTPASGAQFPSGTVNFYDGANLIGSQSVTQVDSTSVGTASLSLSTLAAGIHNDITAQYVPASGNGLIASGSSMSLVVGDPTDNPISYTIIAPKATGIDISPVVNELFNGAVASFSEGTTTDPTGFTATIQWGDGHTSTGTIAFAGTNTVTNISGQDVTVSLFTVSGSNTYSTTGTYPLSVTITDPFSNNVTVNPTARVAYPALKVSGVTTFNAIAGTSLSNQTVATFTDHGLVANLAALGIADPTSQFQASINWGDNSPLDTGTITYNSTTQVFSVNGSHTYTQAAVDTVTVTVTPLTVSVERTDSSDPNALNEVGDENGNGLTDSASADFIDQFVIGAAGQTAPLYTTSLPTVASPGNVALTNSSYSRSEGELSLSTNGQYLVLGGYNSTVDLWGPQSTFSDASVVNRVIGTVDGSGNISTTSLTDAYSGDNFRGVVSTDGTQFWTAGHAGDTTSGFVHSVQLGASTSTIITGPGDPNNINTVEIFNGQLYEAVRKVANDAPAGIYQIGTGLPTTAGQTQTLFFQVPQSNPLDVFDGNNPTGPIGFWMTDLDDGNPTINGVNVAYIADGEMGIARYDYTNSGWQFNYYINSTGTVLNNAYTVDVDGNVTATGNFNPSNPGASIDPSKAGGVRELTGRVVDGQVQLFAVTGFSTTSEPVPGNSLIEVTDTGAGAAFTTLATNFGKSVYTGVAFSPSVTVTSTVTVNVVNKAPAGASNTVTTLEDHAYTFSTADFGFSDPNDNPANNFKAVKITTLPGAGSLTDNGVAVSAGQFVSVTDISGGKLQFTPGLHAHATNYASFTFQVQDDGGTANGGVDTDPTPRTMTINVTENIGILLLDPTGKGALNDTGTGSVKVTGGGAIVVNSSNSQAAIAGGSGVVSATEIDVHGGKAASGQGAFVGTVATGTGPVADPLASLSAPPVPTTVRSRSTLNITTSMTLQPGLYIGGINISGNAHVVLAPGIYYLQGGGFSVSGGATVTDNGQGVLLYNAPGTTGAGITFSGNTQVTLTGLSAAELVSLGLTAPQFAGLQGLAIFQDRNSTAAISLSNSSQVTITGSMYAADATVAISGTASLNLVGNAAKKFSAHLIVGDLTVSNSGVVDVDTSNNSL